MRPYALNSLVAPQIPCMSGPGGDSPLRALEA